MVSIDQLRTRIIEMRDWEILSLKRRYGARWEYMTGTDAGSRYEICEFLLEMIDKDEDEDVIDDESVLL